MVKTGQSEQVKQGGGGVEGETFPSLPLLRRIFYPVLSDFAPHSTIWTPGPRDPPLGTFETVMAASYIERLNSTILRKNKRSRKGTIFVHIQKTRFLSFLFILIICILQSTEKFITTSAYKAELDDEMTFELGVMVTVLEKNFDGWWLVRWVQSINSSICYWPASILPGTFVNSSWVVYDGSFDFHSK